jgi:hypothetical protein
VIDSRYIMGATFKNVRVPVVMDTRGIGNSSVARKGALLHARTLFDTVTLCPTKKRFAALLASQDDVLNITLRK